MNPYSGAQKQNWCFYDFHIQGFPGLVRHSSGAVIRQSGGTGTSARVVKVVTLAPLALALLCDDVVEMPPNAPHQQTTSTACDNGSQARSHFRFFFVFVFITKGVGLYFVRIRVNLPTCRHQRKAQPLSPCTLRMVCLCHSSRAPRSSANSGKHPVCMRTPPESLITCRLPSTIYLFVSLPIPYHRDQP